MKFLDRYIVRIDLSGDDDDCELTVWEVRRHPTRRHPDEVDQDDFLSVKEAQEWIRADYDRRQMPTFIVEALRTYNRNVRPR